ncbi:MAG TPA: hypothetical protein VMF89_13440, partial [Polyangiales bacterium]|nr:hypothetical protein [Polyangiales bacterium]
MAIGEFQEIAHSGGKITFTIATDAKGISYHQSLFRESRSTPMKMIAVHALPNGMAVGRYMLGGIGSPADPPPVRGCRMVMICSDSEGRFGHHCEACERYWRS